MKAVLGRITRAFNSIFGDIWQKPSIKIREHLSDTGNGFALDDLLSIKREADMNEVEKSIYSRIIAIQNESGTADAKLAALANELEKQGR